MARPQTKWEPESRRCQRRHRFISDLLLGGEGGPQHKLREQKVQGGWRKNGQRGQSSNTARRASEGKGEQETEEPESAATSAGSYLDQPFFTCTRPYICPPHVAVRWVGCFLFLLSLCVHISSCYPAAEMVTRYQKKIKKTLFGPN